VHAAWATLEGRLEAVTVRGRPAWRLRGASAPPPPTDPVVRLLPAFDTTLLGHRSRELIVDAEHARRVWPGGGWLHPVVLLDGRAVATWRVARGDVSLEPFVALPDGAAAGLEAEIADVGRFGVAGGR
jgi:Winged helix DNA-binding domain